MDRIPFKPFKMGYTGRTLCIRCSPQLYQQTNLSNNSFQTTKFALVLKKVLSM